MKRTTISLPDELAEKLESYLATQAVAPSLSKVVRTALQQFLDEESLESKLAARGYYVSERKRGPAPTAANLTGEPDISVRHDDYLAEVDAEKVT